MDGMGRNVITYEKTCERKLPLTQTQKTLEEPVLILTNGD